MATRSLMMLRGLIESIPGGSKNIVPTDIQNNTPPSVETQLELVNGDNIIQIPIIADGCVIIFDPTSTTVKTLKGVTYPGPIVGTPGIVLAKTKWNVLTFDTTPPTAFSIDSAGADTGKTTTIIFF